MAERPDGQCWYLVQANGIKRRCYGIPRPGQLYCSRDAHQCQLLDPDERYLKAAYDGNWDEMDTVLTIHPDVSCREVDEIVIRGGHMVILRNLIQQKKHYTSIFDMCVFAAKVGNLDVVQYMVQQEKPTMELVSRMVITATRNSHLNVLQYLWTIPEFKSVIVEAKDSESNVLMISGSMYNFEMVQWILENIAFDIKTKKNVLGSVIAYRYNANINDENKIPHMYFKMVTLLVIIGNVDPAPVWQSLRKEWSKEVYELKVGEDQMLKDFIKTLYLFKKPTKSIQEKLRASRYADLVNQVEKVRGKVSERETYLPDVLDVYFPRNLGTIILDMDTLTIDEMWEMVPRQ
jgi:hypothetical protein